MESTGATRGDPLPLTPSHKGRGDTAPLTPLLLREEGRGAGHHAPRVSMTNLSFSTSRSTCRKLM